MYVRYVAIIGGSFSSRLLNGNSYRESKQRPPPWLISTLEQANGRWIQGKVWSVVVKRCDMRGRKAQDMYDICTGYWNDMQIVHCVESFMRQLTNKTIPCWANLTCWLSGHCLKVWSSLTWESPLKRYIYWIYDCQKVSLEAAIYILFEFDCDSRC